MDAKIHLGSGAGDVALQVAEIVGALRGASSA